VKQRYVFQGYDESFLFKTIAEQNTVRIVRFIILFLFVRDDLIGLYKIDPSNILKALTLCVFNLIIKAI